MPFAIHCPCGVQILIADTITHLQGPCPNCGRPLDVAAHRTAALLAGVSANGELDVPPVPIAVPVLQSEESNPPRTAEAPESIPLAAPVPQGETDPLASLTEGSIIQTHAPRARLYSPLAVAGAGLLGGWLAGCLLLSANYRRMRRAAAARLAVLAGVLGTAGILWAVWKYTDVPPRLGALLYLGPLFLAELLGAALLFLVVARLLLGRTFAAHLAGGGKREAGWVVIGPCLLCSGLFFLMQTLVTYPVTWQGSGGNVVFGSDEAVYFTEGIRRDLAVKLGHKLQEVGYFDNQGAKSVVVSKRDDGFEVRVFVKTGVGLPAIDADALDWLRQFLSREVFDGSPVRLVVCTQLNRVLRVFD
jgi:hypothetical protein